VRLPEICIRRPVLATVMTLIMIIIGCVCYTYLAVRQYPQIEKPVVSVTTEYPGASPEIVETLVTKPLEAALAGIEGLDYMTSSSEAGLSRIDIHLRPERDLDDAASDVRDKLARVQAKMPEGSRRSTIKKADSDASPILYLALYGEGFDNAELADYAEHRIKNELEAIPGVASIDIFGGNGYQMHIWLEPVKLAAYGVTVQDVMQALRRQNVHVPGGRLKGEEREFHVATAANLKSTAEFNNIVILKRKDYLVRLGDVGRAEFGPAEEKDLVRFNDKPAVGIGIIKKSIANPIEISTELHKILPDIIKQLPKGSHLDVALDRSVFIKESINEVYHTVAEATIFVLVVILAFLWSFRAAVIPLVTIPVSLISTCALLYIFGFSINILTLLAIVLAIGLVVDDAIVVMENVHRYIERGMKPLEAAIKGSTEISFAVIAMTITLAAVYAPIALSKGQMGKLFTEFALTLAGSVLISGFVALTLSPMMCSKLLTAHISTEENFSDRIYRHISHRYGLSLKWALGHRWIVIIIAFIFVVAGLLISFYGMQSELAPQEDQGIITSQAHTPQGATISYVKEHMNYVEEPFRHIPEVEKRLTVIQAPRSTSWNILKPWEKRKRSAKEINDVVRQDIRNVVGLQAFSGVTSSLGGGSRSTDEVSFVMQTTKSYEEINAAASQLAHALRAKNVMEWPQTDRGTDVHEFRVDIDRTKAASLGVDVSTIGETVDALLSGRRASDYRKDSDQFDVVVSVDAKERRAPENLSRVYVKGFKDTMIPLSNLVTIKKEAVPTQINHFNQLRSVTLTSRLYPGKSLGEAIKAIKEVSDEVLPEGIKTDFSGATKELIESQNTTYLIFGLALIFIYLVMAAQFESFTDPFIIMFTVPLSLAGAVITLKVTGGTFNMFTYIGFVTLIGLITKHGILIVDFANNIRQKGTAVKDSVFEATLLRLRPILMTTFAMVLGALPLVIAGGAGAESRHQIGWVVVGGMTVGTLFTLYVIPTIYTFFSRKKEA